MCLSHYRGGRCMCICMCVDNESSNNSRTETKNVFLITNYREKFSREKEIFHTEFGFSKDIYRYRKLTVRPK
jgi:hypothetical protein